MHKFPAINSLNLSSNEYLMPKAFIGILDYLEGYSRLTELIYKNNLLSKECLSRLLRILMVDVNIRSIQISL